MQEELIRAKSNVSNSVGINIQNSKGRSVRESVNQLRLSLNRSLILPRIDDDVKEEVNVNEDDVRELRLQIDNMHSSDEDILKDSYENKNSHQFSCVEEGSDTDLASEQYGSCLEECEIEECNASVDSIARTIDTSFKSNRKSFGLQEPMLSESPKINNNRKSVTFASVHLESQNIVSDSSKFDSDALRQSLRPSDHIRSSLRSSKIFSGPTESLAASLHRGLEIIDYHQRNSASSTPDVAFSFEHLALKSSQTVDKANASFLCASCGNKNGSTVQVRLDSSSLVLKSCGLLVCVHLFYFSIVRMLEKI